MSTTRTSTPGAAAARARGAEVPQAVPGPDHRDAVVAQDAAHLRQDTAQDGLRVRTVPEEATDLARVDEDRAEGAVRPGQRAVEPEMHRETGGGVVHEGLEPQAGVHPVGARDVGAEGAQGPRQGGPSGAEVQDGGTGHDRQERSGGTAGRVQQTAPELVRPGLLAVEHDRDEGVGARGPQSRRGHVRRDPAPGLVIRGETEDAHLVDPPGRTREVPPHGIFPAAAATVGRVLVAHGSTQ
ncbi:hypothetical protein [Georgenia sp. SUBG003]|uniref:hypothetical protein n=1 Tax=Georgenia sp. SUBG003 TaxID=1497974 RepID=UPI003AB6AC01